MDSNVGLTALSSLIDHKDRQIAEFGLAGLTQLDPFRTLNEDFRLELLDRCKNHLSTSSKNRKKIAVLFGPVTRSEPSATPTGPESLDVGFKHFIVAQNGAEVEVSLNWPLADGEIAAEFIDDDDYNPESFVRLLRNDDGERFYQLLPRSLESPQDMIVASALLHAWIARLQRFDKSDIDKSSHSDEMLEKMLDYDGSFYFPATAYAISYAVRHASPTQTNAFLRGFIDKYNSTGKHEMARPYAFVDDQGNQVTELFATNLVTADILLAAVKKDAEAVPPYSGVEDLVNDFVRVAGDATAIAPDLAPQ